MKRKYKILKSEYKKFGNLKYELLKMRENQKEKVINIDKEEYKVLEKYKASSCLPPIHSAQRERPLG